MKPSFAALFKGYPLRHEYQREALYAQLGWSDIKTHPAYQDTCAIRVSVALAAAGIAIPGRMTIKDGLMKGKPIEPGQARLSYVLKRLWGAPEIYRDRDKARNGIGNRRGVISFFNINGGAQGHIDLIKPDANGFHACAMACQFGAKEIWFWPLN